jgi:hypothetical protein
MSKIYSNAGYCRCGCEIWIEYLLSSNEWFYRYFDLNHKEITACPNCGKEIKEDDLESM